MNRLQSNEKLREALLLAQEWKMQQLDEELKDIPDHEFSARFEKRMKKMLKYSNKSYFRFVSTAGKRAAIWIVIIATLLTTTMSVEAIRTPVVNFFVEIYEKFTSIIYDNDPNGDVDAVDEFPESIEVRYVPSALKDYPVLDEMDMIHEIYTSFSLPTGESILFKQHTITSLIVQADTEDIEYETLKINDYDAIFYTKNGQGTIIWVDGQYGFLLVGHFDKESLVRMTHLEEKQ